MMTDKDVLAAAIRLKTINPRMDPSQLDLKRLMTDAVNVAESYIARLSGDQTSDETRASINGAPSEMADTIDAKLLELLERTSTFVPKMPQALLPEIEEAIAAARAQAEDDAKPVDEEWLKSIDQESKQGFLVLEEFYAQWDNGKFMLGGFVTSSPVGWSLEGKTRGDVRRLLAALGVKENSNG